MWACQNSPHHLYMLENWGPSKLRLAGIIARKENEKLACEKFLARNKVQEMREICGYKFVHFCPFLNQIDQLSTPKKRRSSHPLLDCWSAWIIIHTNWLWLGIWSWNIFADVSFELACHWTYLIQSNVFIHFLDVLPSKFFWIMILLLLCY